MAEGQDVAGSPAAAEWERRRRRAAVFGDTLPETTSDERDPQDGAGDAGDVGGRGEAWLKAQVPPHHGG